MIYIDIDGVLCDFQKFVIQQTGEPYKGSSTWKILENIDNLFLHLEIMKGSHQSIQRLVRTFGYNNVEILTALPLITGKLTTAQRDKVNFVHWYIDEALQVNCVSNWSHKKYFCRNSKDILIDDRVECIQEWKDAGGIGILHINWEGTNKELKKIGVL